MIRTMALATPSSRPGAMAAAARANCWPGPRPASGKLRISVAAITRDGPFSAFAGVQRWFAVLRGDGVMLRAGRWPHHADTRRPATGL
jgi:environmental stress-induced protein Ves